MLPSFHSRETVGTPSEVNSHTLNLINNSCHSDNKTPLPCYVIVVFFLGGILCYGSKYFLLLSIGGRYSCICLAEGLAIHVLALPGKNVTASPNLITLVIPIQLALAKDAWAEFFQEKSLETVMGFCHASFPFAIKSEMCLLHPSDSWKKEMEKSPSQSLEGLWHERERNHGGHTSPTF